MFEGSAVCQKHKETSGLHTRCDRRGDAQGNAWGDTQGDARGFARGDARGNSLAPSISILNSISLPPRYFHPKTTSLRQNKPCVSSAPPP